MSDDKSLRHRIEACNEQGQLVGCLDRIHEGRQHEAEHALKNLEKAKTRLQGLQDDLLGDLLNQCFEEAK